MELKYHLFANEAVMWECDLSPQVAGLPSCERDSPTWSGAGWKASASDLGLTWEAVQQGDAAQTHTPSAQPAPERGRRREEGVPSAWPSEHPSEISKE